MKLKNKKARVLQIFFIVIILVIVIVVGLSLYLFLQFNTGDFVYNENTGLVGEIKGISLPIDYLVQWQDGELSKESLFNIRSLSEITDFEAMQIFEKEKTSELYFYPGDLEIQNIEEIIDIGDMTGEEIIPKISEKGNFVSILGEFDCKPHFVCGEWGKCQAVYDLDMLLTKELVSGFQYRYCKDYSRCISDFVDSRKCETQIKIFTEKITLGGKEYVEVYDENNVLISRLKSEGDEMDVQLLFDEFEYLPYCYDGVKNFDEDEIDCVSEAGGNCSKCGQKFYGEKANYILRYLILIFLLILCVVFMIIYFVLKGRG